VQWVPECDTLWAWDRFLVIPGAANSSASIITKIKSNVTVAKLPVLRL